MPFSESAMQILCSGAVPRVSFEFFPPKTPEMEARLWEAVTELEPLTPSFVSVTYGAGGSTRERTHATVKRMIQETSLKPAAHLTCVAATKNEINQVADDYWEAGVRHIVALRGDMPEAKPYQPHSDGYANAAELTLGLRKRHDFEISVAAYPEKHPDSEDFNADIDMLKRKIDHGATRAITQYFFDIEHYLRFVERARAAGITIPIVPGILPVSNVAQVMKFSAASGTSVPLWLEEIFQGLDKHPGTRSLVAAHVASLQCRLLQREGVRDFHFYTLNRAELTRAICHTLGLRP